MPSSRHYIYLVPGFFGFSNLGELKYFGHVRQFLAESCAAGRLRAEVHVVKIPPTSSLPRRAACVAETIARTTGHRKGIIHLIGHSSGGLDIRLLTAPDVVLPTDIDVEQLAGSVRTVVTVATPHHGTPIASFFTGLLGERLLQALSLSTMYVLRFGQPPLAVLLQLGAIFSRLDDLAINSPLLDELFARLLGNFSVGRRRSVQQLLGAIASDQALLVQLTPEAMDVFNALTATRHGVRFGSVVARARQPSVRSTLTTGLDPSAQATHAVYHALYRLAARTPRARLQHPTRAQAAVLRHAYGRLPSVRANDGLVPTRSQVWGEVLHATEADHLDVLGHFGDPWRTPPHFDWLATGTGFTREKFETLWTDVFHYIATG